MNFIKTNYHISRLGSAHVTSHLLAQLQIVSPVWTPIGMIEFSSILHCSWVDWEDRIFHLAPCMQCHLSGHCTARLYYCTSFALQKSVWDILVVWKNKFHSTSPVPNLKNLHIRNHVKDQPVIKSLFLESSRTRTFLMNLSDVRW